MNELLIDETNFDEHFFDVRKHGPKAGQVLAKFRAVAKLIEGEEKKDIIKLLACGKVQQAVMVVNKIHCAVIQDSYKVCREICEDLIETKDPEFVNKKPYSFVLESLYYTKKENVPTGDPHWETIPTLSYDDETKTFSCKIDL